MHGKTSLGFTLMELMVVIAIIGVFASVTLSSLSEVRLLVKSTANNEVVRQNILALESIRTQTGTYPYVPVPHTRVCLAEYDDDFCGVNNFSPKIQSVLDQISRFYSVESEFDVVGWGGAIPIVIEGPTYECTEKDPAAKTCSAYEIFWAQRGVDQPCLPSTHTLNGRTLQGSTVCFYLSR